MNRHGRCEPVASNVIERYPQLDPNKPLHGVSFDAQYLRETLCKNTGGRVVKLVSLARKSTTSGRGLRTPRLKAQKIC
jgi:hypothetical protein